MANMDKRVTNIETDMNTLKANMEKILILLQKNAKNSEDQV